MKKAKTKTHRNAVKTLTYAYIRKIKKWMFCPACQNGKMTINKKSTLWICEDCGYILSADEFEDDYVFWFCDECNTYLNNIFPHNNDFRYELYKYSAGNKITIKYVSDRETNECTISLDKR